MGNEHFEVGDTLAFRLGEVLPADDPLAEWLVLLAMALNDIALVNDRLEQDYESPHAYLYWLRLGLAHFFESVRMLKRAAEIPEVAGYIASLPEDVRTRYDECLAIFEERRTELVMMRDLLFHYLAVWRGRERVIQPALEAMKNDHATLKTGTIRTGRNLYADDVAAAIFTRATGIPWEDVRKEASQLHVGKIQQRIEQAVTAFVRFANPALMEYFSRVMADGIPFHKVEPVDPEDWRQGWKAVRS